MSSSQVSLVCLGGGSQGSITLEPIGSLGQLSSANFYPNKIVGREFSSTSLGSSISVQSFDPVFPDSSLRSIDEKRDPRMQALPPELIAAMMQASPEKQQQIFDMEANIHSLEPDGQPVAPPVLTKKPSLRTCEIMLLLLHEYEGDELKSNLKNLLKKQGYPEGDLDSLASEIITPRQSEQKKKRKLGHNKKMSRSVPVLSKVDLIHEEEDQNSENETDSYEPSRRGVCIERPRLLRQKSKSESMLPQATVSAENNEETNERVQAEIPKWKRFIPKRFRREN